MALSYKRLWKLLIDRDMKRKDLHRVSGVSTATLAKMSRGESVAASILDRICLSLKCGISDVVEVVPDSMDKNGPVSCSLGGDEDERM